MAEDRVLKRSSNLELYRIIVMFLILCGHYVFNSNLLHEFWGSFSIYSLFYSIFGMWGKVGINCFVMISGYFMCQSRITLRKFLKLYLEVVFYSLVIYCMFVITGRSSFTLQGLFLQLTPFWKIESDSFVSAYIIWWLFIPFLNIIVHGMQRKQHLLLIGLCVIVFTIYPLLPFTRIAINPLCWFSTLYLIASYLKIYPKTIFKGDSARFWGGMTILLMVLAVLGMALSLYGASKWEWQINPYWLVMDYNAPLALLIGVSSFICFKSMKLRHSSFINIVASTTFGILLIHARSDEMRQWLWNEVVGSAAHYSRLWYAFIACVCVYSLCSIIDWLRIKFLENPVFKCLDKIIN